MNVSWYTKHDFSSCNLLGSWFYQFLKIQHNEVLLVSKTSIHSKWCIQTLPLAAIYVLLQLRFSFWYIHLWWKMINGTSIVSLHVFILVYSLEDDFHFLPLAPLTVIRPWGQESHAKDEEEHRFCSSICVTLLAW